MERGAADVRMTETPPRAAGASKSEWISWNCSGASPNATPASADRVYGTTPRRAGAWLLGYATQDRLQ